ncbi:MAG: hypothetical protein ABW003_13375 [Microvirga sp.]
MTMPKSITGRIAFFAVVFVLYVVSTVPIGLALYTIKSRMGFNIFQSGGFHAFTACIDRQISTVKGTK